MIGPRSQPSTGGTGSHATILLVEDDRLIRLALSHELRKSGYEVLAAETAEGVLALLLADPARVDAVLSDFQLPGLSGLDLLDELHARGVSVPVLLMSAHPDELLRALQRGHQEVPWLAKPFGENELTTRLARLLAGTDDGS